MMDPVRAEQLSSIHPLKFPDIGIWRSPLTNRMMLTYPGVVASETSTSTEFLAYDIVTTGGGLHKEALENTG